METIIMVNKKDYKFNILKNKKIILPPCDSASGKEVKIDTLQGADDIHKEPDLTQGYVLAPYVLVNCDKPSKAYREFMDKYREEHMFCPVCGGTQYSSTLVGYVFNTNKPEKYKDRNICVCQICGNRHIVHERVAETKI